MTREEMELWFRMLGLRTAIAALQTSNPPDQGQYNKVTAEIKSLLRKHEILESTLNDLHRVLGVAPLADRLETVFTQAGVITEFPSQTLHNLQETPNGRRPL